MKVVLQDGVKDCGVCCLLSIIRFYGGDVSKEFLRGLTNTTKTGVNAYDLIKAAEEIGFKAIGMKGDLTKIQKNNLPCLAHFIVNKQYKHFVVIYEINYKNKKVILMDPAKGKKIISFSEFNLLSTSYYIFLTPIKKLPIMTSKNTIINIVIEYLKKEKLFIILLIILVILYFVFQIVIAYHFKYLLVYCINYNYSSSILLISFIIFMIYLLKEINDFLKTKLLAKITHQLDSIMLFTSYKQILLLPYLYYKNRTTGEIIQRFHDLTTIKNYMVNLIISSLTDLLGFIVFLIILFKINPMVTLMILIFNCILLIYISFINKKKKRIIKILNKSEDNVNSYLIESLSSVDSLKNNHSEKKTFDIFSLKYKSLLVKNYELLSINSKINLFKNSINDLSITIMFGIGSYLIIRGKLELSEIIVYQSFFNYYLICFYKIIDMINNYSGFKISLERVNDLFINNQEKFIGSSYYLGYRLNKDIIINKLYYKVKDKVLFNNVNLKISNKEKVLIIGNSGVGKSTLAKILMRYIDVDFGMISINNIDINHYHLEVIRNNITYVSTNELLFSNSIYYNITLGREIDEVKFNKIVKLTKVDELIKDKDLGYKYLVEENGFNFSSGEKQRILLARALLRESDIYIFDEAFSQIDFKNRMIIIKNILSYLDNKTVIIISHNMNNYALFDKVLKLEGGKIYVRKKL